jgi:hypothetical protein
LTDYQGEMAYFYEYMRGLADRRGLRKAIDGGIVQYRFTLPLDTLVEVTCHDLDPSFACLVQSEPWAAPLNALDHQNFLRAVLKGNRSALHLISAGVVEDIKNPAVYRLVWFVPRDQGLDNQWYEGLLEFDKLYKAFNKVLGGSSSKNSTGMQANTFAQGQFQIFMP